MSNIYHNIEFVVRYRTVEDQKSFNPFTSNKYHSRFFMVILRSNIKILVP